MKKILCMFCAFPIVMSAYAENNNLTLVCKGTLDYIEYPLKKNLADATISENSTITYNIKNNLLLGNETSIAIASCKFREDKIYCLNDNKIFYRSVSIDRVSGKISDDAKHAIEQKDPSSLFYGITAIRNHFEGMCIPAKRQF